MVGSLMNELQESGKRSIDDSLIRATGDRVRWVYSSAPALTFLLVVKGLLPDLDLDLCPFDAEWPSLRSRHADNNKPTAPLLVQHMVSCSE